MKTLKCITVLFVVVCMAFSCRRGTSIIISNGSDYTEIRYEGEVRFSDDEKSVKSITPDGYLKFRKNNLALLAKSNFHGEVNYEVYYNGRKYDPSGNDAKKFIAEAIQEMIANGFDAKGRLLRLYDEGGSDALLDEVNTIKSDHLKSMYLDYVLATDDLSKEKLVEAGERIRMMGADHEKSELLKKFAVVFLQDSTAASAWLKAVSSMGADFEKANALKAMLNEPLNDEQFDLVSGATKIVNAEFERGNILKLMIDKRPSSAGNFDNLLVAINGIHADVEKANLLKKLVETGIPEGEPFDRLLDAVGRLGGDIDKTTMLAYLSNKGIRSDQQWISLINAAAKISSDLDKTNLLVQISHKMPESENVKANYMLIAETITSDPDYRRAVKEVKN